MQTSTWSFPRGLRLAALSLVVDAHTATFTDGAGHHETFTERVGATRPKTVCS